MILSLTTFSIMTLCLKCLLVTLSINDAQHNNKAICWVSLFIYFYAECHYAKFHYSESRGAKTGNCSFVKYFKIVIDSECVWSFCVFWTNKNFPNCKINETVSATILSLPTFSIMTPCLKCLLVTLIINDAQHNNKAIWWVSQFIYFYAECSYAECHYEQFCYAESCGAKTGNCSIIEYFIIVIDSECVWSFCVLNK